MAQAKAPENKAKNSSLRTERDKFVAFSFAGAHLLVELNGDGTIMYASGSSCGLTKGEVESLVERPFSEIVMPEDRPYMVELIKRLTTSGRIEPTRVRLLSAAEKIIFALIGGSCLPTLPGHVFLSISMPPQIQHDDRSEGTAGLLNQEGFAAAANERLQAAKRMNFDHDITFLVLDCLSEFSKNSNREGFDGALEELSAVLRASSIGGDSAGMLEKGKFGLVHDKDFNEDKLHGRISEILKKHLGEEKETAKTFSLKFDAGELSEIDATKALMYSIQKFSEGDINRFDISSLANGAQKLLEDTAERIQHVRQTISDKDFDIVFQPIVSLDMDKIHHFEALTRLNGVSSPAEFITFTEEVGMIEDFDLTVCEKVVTDIQSHSKTGWHPHIALNLSARSLASDIFIEQLLHTIKPLADVGNAKQLMFEVTETQAIHDFERMAVVLQGFRESGHEIAMDDMGSGSTALSTLRQLPVDYAKLDGQLIRDAATDERTMALMKSIIELSKSLDTKIIAEQIETDKQAMMMHLLGVEYGQGYLYGKPARDYRGRYSNYGDPEKERARRKGSEETWG